ncbi:MAG: class I SAM-dependent methyltransferase [Spirochaetales bacterium]|nr:class I SAM-dependent methyltransferase [Spirochaetales bacterium]
MIKTYFNKQAEVWDEMFTETDLNKLKEVSDFMYDIAPGSTVLDVGTGTGRFVPFILDKIGNKGRLICIDLAEEMLNKCKAKSFKGTIDYICADISCSNLPGSAFNAVICYSSFPHFQDKEKALKEIHRILKDNGTLFICHSSGREFINKIHSEIPEVHNDLLPTKTEINTMLHKAGFREIIIIDNEEKYMVKGKKS